MLSRFRTDELIEQLNPATTPVAERGWRARFGLRPSRAEQMAASHDAWIRAPFERPVTIMVANPKGGVGKTPLSLLIAAAFGTHRGGGVMAWDNNELRGTMPSRSVSHHDRNVRDLLDAAPRLLDRRASFVDLAPFLNHQVAGRFHTLGSAQTSGHVVSRADYMLLREVLTRFFQVVVVDTGNNEAAPNWRAAAESADCLVVPVKWRKDSLIPASRMLESLEQQGLDVVNRVVIVATNGPTDVRPEVKKTGATWFNGLRIHEVPTDAHIAQGGVLEYSKLHDRTRRSVDELSASVAQAMMQSVANPAQQVALSSTP